MAQEQVELEFREQMLTNATDATTSSNGSNGATTASI